MNLETILTKLNLNLRSGSSQLKKNVTGGYTGDLLSDVMANARAGDIWITRQVHQNVVAIAVLKELSGIIMVNSCEPAKDTLEKAVSENVPILVSDLPAFELTGRIYHLIKGA